MDNWRSLISWSYLSSHYGHLNALNDKAFESALASYGRTWDAFLPRRRSIACLDIGCGPGQFLHYLKRRGFSNVCGVDLSPENVRFARDKGFDVQCADALDFLHRALEKDERFGLISVHDLIEHLTKQEVVDLFVLIAKVLEPTGIVLVKTTNANSLIAGYAMYMDLTHELSFTEESLRQLFLSTGLTQYAVIRCRPKGIRNHIRRMLKLLLYWFVYRVIESRSMPKNIDLDILAWARR